MKRFLGAFCLMSLLCSASSATTIECQSATYTVVARNIEATPDVNYGINKKMNTGADVSLDKSYISDRILALSLKVDGQPGKFEVSAVLGKSGQYKGLIYADKISQTIKCTKK